MHLRDWLSEIPKCKERKKQRSWRRVVVVRLGFCASIGKSKTIRKVDTRNAAEFNANNEQIQVAEHDKHVLLPSIPNRKRVEGHTSVAAGTGGQLAINT